MRLNLWLAQPETERKLAAALRVAVAAFACWSLAAAYGLWSTQSALAASRAAVLSQSTKITDAAQGLPGKRAEAARAVRVDVAASKSAASADLTDELSRVAQVAGAEIAGVRMGDGEQGAAQASAGPANSGASASAATPAPAVTTAPAGGGWNQETFDCNVAGDDGALTRFLDLLAASRHILDITSLEVTQTGAKSKADGPHLEMKLSGIVYALSEKA